MPYALPTFARRVCGIGVLLAGSGVAVADGPTGQGQEVRHVPVPPLPPLPPRVAVDEPRFQWAVTPVTVMREEQGRLPIDLLLPEGFHVFRQDIVLQVLDPAGLTVGPPVLPAGEPVVLDEDEPPVERYRGDVRIELPLAAVGATPGPRLVHLQAEVRGCSAVRCLEGTRAELEVWVQVLDREVATRTEPAR